MNWVMIGPGIGLFGAKSLSEPMLTNCQLDSWEHGNKFQWNLNLNYINFVQENAIKNVVCQNGGHLVRGVELRHIPLGAKLWILMVWWIGLRHASDLIMLAWHIVKKVWHCYPFVNHKHGSVYTHTHIYIYATSRWSKTRTCQRMHIHIPNMQCLPYVACKPMNKSNLTTKAQY